MASISKLLGRGRNKHNGPIVDVWSIGLYAGASLDKLAPLGANPILSISSVTDRRARLVADPFITKSENGWYIFFEMFDCVLNRGVIAAAASTNLEKWDYLGVVLEEPFHLSYPYIFESGGAFYMVPESKGAKEVRLYKAVNFPYKWEYQKTLLTGKFVDTSIVRFENYWWLFTSPGAYSLAAYCSEDLLGKWKRHKKRLLYWHNKVRGRPGGRIVPYNGGLVRFSQDSAVRYGHQLRAFFIERLSPTEFVERPMFDEPILTPGSSPWSSWCMHQIDSWQAEDGRWYAVVDGAQQVERTKLDIVESGPNLCVFP